MTGADDVDYAWYVLDDDDDDYTEATAVGTKSTYKVGQADLGKYILVVVEDEDGDIAVSDVTSAVAEKDVELPDNQIEGVISIEDVSGLQSDGTGLIGDTLRAVVPATMGSFSNVIFYRDGKQLNSTTQNGAAMATVANRAGKYTVSVIGSDNKVYLSDSIDVVDKEAPAIILSAGIADDYATPNIVVGTSDNEAVISVSLNKHYVGTISLYKASDLKFTGVADATESTAITNGGGGAASVDETASLFTTAQVAARTDGNVVVYRDPETGVATYQWTVAGGLVRGTEYRVVFDQNSITTDTPGQGNENEAEDTITVPYLETPASMSIDSVGNGQPVVISFKNESGETMTWMGNPNAVNPNTMLSQLKVYSDTNNDMKDGTDLNATFAAGQLKNGVLTSNANGTTAAFYYATAKTLSGLFGSKSIDLASTLGEAAQAAADSIGIAQDSSDPYSAKISFSNLRTDGTVYVLQSDDATTNGNANTDMLGEFANGQISAKASTAVEKGTKEVVISGAIDALKANYDHYLAVFIPNDTVNYSQVATQTASAAGIVGLKVVQKFTNVKVAQNTTVDAKAKDGKQYYIVGVDQFGNDYALAAQAAVQPTKTVDSVDAADGTVAWAANTVDGTALTSGQITFAKGTTEAIKGHTYEYTLDVVGSGATDTLKCKIVLTCEDSKTSDDGTDDVFSIAVNKL